jgi:uncharacterized glyoxalase superfamily protein PhnB
MHAHLKVRDADLMFSDTFAGMPYQPGNTIQIAIHPKEEAEREKSSPLWKTADKSSSPFIRRILAPFT